MAHVELSRYIRRGYHYCIRLFVGIGFRLKAVVVEPVFIDFILYFLWLIKLSEFFSHYLPFLSGDDSAARLAHPPKTYCRKQKSPKAKRKSFSFETRIVLTRQHPRYHSTCESSPLDARNERKRAGSTQLIFPPAGCEATKRRPAHGFPPTAVSLKMPSSVFSLRQRLFTC